jgi:hypothetical protein
MKRSRPLLIDIIDNLKLKNIINISELSLENFQKSCQWRGIKMNENQILNYYKLLKMRPKDYEVINQNLKIEFDKNKNMRNIIEKNLNEIKGVMEEMIKLGSDYINIELDKFIQICRNKEVKLENVEIENLFNLIQKYFFDFIKFIDSFNIDYYKYDEELEIKSFKLDAIARIESQPLPLVMKLSV